MLLHQIRQWATSILADSMGELSATSPCALVPLRFCSEGDTEIALIAHPPPTKVCGLNG